MTTKEKDSKTTEKEVITEAEINGATATDSETNGTACDSMTDESFENNDTESCLTDEINIYKDKYLRLSAEFDNYRKRTLKEKMDLIENGGSDVMKSILTVLDDFDRAKEAMQKTDDIDVVKQGSELIHQKLIDILKQRGLKEIEAYNTEFDTDFCEAIVKIPVENPAQKGKVVDVIEKGYTLKEKVLRFAKVVVGE